MRRRKVFLGLAVGAATLPLMGAAAATFRWHSQPRRVPYLTDAHLLELRNRPAGAGPRVLFVGNSMTLRHDLPGAVAALAAADGVALQVAVAAARGSRLIETWQVDPFRAVLDLGWDVLVLQDFSATCLRATDRWGSAYAMRMMAQAARAGGVLLYPTWAFPPRHRIYREGAGVLTHRPAGPEAFAQCITAHYAGIAEAQGWTRAPVTEALQPDATRWLEADLHHPNPQGTARIAAVLWQSLQALLPRDHSVSRLF